ncbi:hypothetical protein Pth03_43860 [Planotetraspora thailandica]|uniref:Uncharacterized protein n=1 Tax=Planotetraspora thailandica TaxID=487172 RepID=A0A8J3V287_9ACTN|nr:hypothetical protein Pth03_43860 [Planotetraspora thailandica]
MFRGSSQLDHATGRDETLLDLVEIGLPAHLRAITFPTDPPRISVEATAIRVAVSEWITADFPRRCDRIPPKAIRTSNKT